ncbi:dual specificity protein phosphatase 12 isoform X5 [Canis lupus dingo]|uniref:dual specificity protein phosphatase 12 isoform X1 n=1 Tax=Canis lupus familiaris TaxID=9615 RepID=UPI0018F686CB|nr:dual specificity protein phosphatase 12 isoform X1 [Canis lupus familiaris]XP_048962798.1 dual specificity protein phosphatase 12 isoform X5 [Canis lupus dingo]
MLGARGGHGCERPESAGGRAGRAGHLLEVRPGLYLGGAAAVAEPGLLREAGITAVLAVDSEEPDLTAGAGTEGLRRLFVRALDEPETDLLSHLDRCAAFIGQARAEGRAVLVHCHAGVSRSVAVVTAFMMKTDQLTFEKAYESLQTIKPEAKMNEGFEWQLKLYQAMGYEVDTSSAIYKQYRLQKVTEKYPGSQAQCTSYFIEPVQWMESALLGVMDGQLLCPKCNAKLGSFNWYGEQCSCGRWITPAFQIHKNRVDEMKMLPVLGSQTRKI